MKALVSFCFLARFIEYFNSLPSNKILSSTNLKAFADNISNVVQMMICVNDWVENIVGKGENAV